MTLDEFRMSLSEIAPPAGLTHTLAGLWWSLIGNGILLSFAELATPTESEKRMAA
jgi:hypothetical protein